MKKHLLLLGLTAVTLGYTNAQTMGNTDTKSTQDSIEKPMEEAVVIGYATAKKKDLTGSIASIKGAEIMQQPVLTASQALQSKMAGVQITNSGAPGSAPNVRIRGTGSVIGGAEPLYVVDGIITDDIRNINTADILTIDVLKDASSTAIYGVRAANGGRNASVHGVCGGGGAATLGCARVVPEVFPALLGCGAAARSLFGMPAVESGL